MLTDIFAYRYEDTPIWQTVGEQERRLLVQASQIVSGQLFPYWVDGKEDADIKAKWNTIHDKLCRELGLKELSPKTWGNWTKFQGQDYYDRGEYTIDKVCETFVLAGYDASTPADRFMKERISFVEIAFREREEEITEINSKLPMILMDAVLYDASPSKPRNIIPGSRTETVKAYHETLNRAFKEAVEELNERFRRSGCGLNYHNGFIQQSSDELTKDQIEVPFWELVSGDDWKNVDFEMKDAIDRRDTGVRDPSLYAAKALESTIKIISGKKGWTTGNEGGAHAHIDNLCNKTRGGNLIEEWEKETLKQFFSKVRNPLGHGSGGEKMPELNPQQTDWAIEFCMSWIKSLIKRV